MAFGVFLDTQTSGNDGNGLEAIIVSTDGNAMGGVLSSDVLLAMLPDFLPVDPIPFRPLGVVIANGNEDCGIRLNVSGADFTMGYVVGATATATGTAKAPAL
jgi:hypothetical protein